MTAGTRNMIAKKRTSLVQARGTFFAATQTRISTPFEGGGPAIRSRVAFTRNRAPLIINEIPPSLRSPFGSMPRPSSKRLPSRTVPARFLLFGDRRLLRCVGIRHAAAGTLHQVRISQPPTRLILRPRGSIRAVTLSEMNHSVELADEAYLQRIKSGDSGACA